LPDTGFVFSNWTGGFISTTNPLTFVMRSNLVLRANFVPDPFPEASGAYSGLFFNPEDPRHGSSGFFSATVKDSGSFSGFVQTGNSRRSFSGGFDLNGSWSNQVERPGTNAITITLHLDLHGAKQITGVITDGSWLSGLNADRRMDNSSQPKATNFTGSYTMVILGESASGPRSGDGFGRLKVNSTATVQFVGTLGDGTQFSQNVPLSESGDWPCYISLYSGKGAVMGWIRLLPDSTLDMQGDLVWFRPQMKSGYTNSFVFMTEVIGSVHRPSGTNRVFSSDSALVTLEDGGLPQPLVNEVTLGPKAVVKDAEGDDLSLKVSVSNGLFSGKVALPNSRTRISFKGVILQRQAFGAGFFEFDDQFGRIYFGP